MLKTHRYIFLVFILCCYHQVPLEAAKAVKQKKGATTIECFLFSPDKNLENEKISTEKKYVLKPYFINTKQKHPININKDTKPTRILIDIRHLQRQIEQKKKNNSIGKGTKKKEEINDEVYKAFKTYLESIASYLDDTLNTQNSEIIYFVIDRTKDDKYKIIKELQVYMSQFQLPFSIGQSQTKKLPLLKLLIRKDNKKPFITLSKNKKAKNEEELSMIMCATTSFYKQNRCNLKVVNKNGKYKIVLQKKSVLAINHREITKDDNLEETAKSILLFAGKPNDDNVTKIIDTINNRVNFGDNNATNYYIDLTANSLPSTTKDEVVDYFKKVTEYLKNTQKKQNTDFLESIKDNIWFVIPTIDRINNVKAFLTQTLGVKKDETKCWISIMDSIKQISIFLGNNIKRTSTRFILKTPKKKNKKKRKEEVGMLIVNKGSDNNVNAKIRDQLQTFKKVTFEEKIVEAGNSFKKNNYQKAVTDYYIDLTANSLPSMEGETVRTYFQGITESFKSIQYIKSKKSSLNTNGSFSPSIKHNIWLVIYTKNTIEDVKKFLVEKSKLDNNENEYPWLELSKIKFVKLNVDKIKQISFKKNPINNKTGSSFKSNNFSSSSERSSIENDTTKGSNSLNVQEHNTNEPSPSPKNDQNKNTKKVNYTGPRGVTMTTSNTNSIQAPTERKNNLNTRPNNNQLSPSQKNDQNKNVNKNDKSTVIRDSTTTGPGPVEPKVISPTNNPKAPPQSQHKTNTHELPSRHGNNNYKPTIVSDANSTTTGLGPVEPKVISPTNSPKTPPQSQHKTNTHELPSRHGNNNCKPTIVSDANNSTTTGPGPVESKTRNLQNFIIIAITIVLIVIVGYLISRASKPKQAFPNRGSRPIQPSSSHTPVPKEPPVSKQIKAQASSSKGSPGKAPLVFKYKSLIIAIALLLLLALLFLIRRSVLPNK